nr:MAG TPA: hypothetical protein [Caudoviricetes sp.]
MFVPKTITLGIILVRKPLHLWLSFHHNYL